MKKAEPPRVVHRGSAFLQPVRHPRLRSVPERLFYNLLIGAEHFPAGNVLAGLEIAVLTRLEEACFHAPLGRFGRIYGGGLPDAGGHSGAAGAGGGTGAVH